MPWSLPRALLLLLLFAAWVPAQEEAPPPGAVGEAEIKAEDLSRHVSYLASDELKGRQAGGEGEKLAADYILKHFRELGLGPAGERKDSFDHRFAIPNAVCRNLVAVLPGSDRRLRREYVVLGAHMDHVGLGTYGSRTQAKGQIHNGADDNASGTAMLLELAQAFAKEPPKRLICFIAFSAEEMGLLGSKAFVKTPTIPLKNVHAMVNLDMVGRSRDRYLFVGGINTIKGSFEELVRDINGAEDLSFQLELNGGGTGPSDFDPFYKEGVPVIFCFTAEHPQYHTPDDDAHLIEAAAHHRVALFAHRLARRIADGPALRFQKDDRQAMPASSSRGVDWIDRHLDMEVEASGQRVVVKRLKSGGKGAKLGLAPGDVIVSVDDLELHHPLDLQSAMACAFSKQRVSLVVEREGKRRTAKVTL